MTAARRLAAALILAALVSVIGLDVWRPGPSAADDNRTKAAQTEASTTTGQAADTTVAPTTAAPASTTTAPATATTTTAPATATTAPAPSTTVAPTATTAPATTVAPTSTTAPAGAGSTTTTDRPAAGSTRTTARRTPTTVAEPTGAARRQAPVPPRGESASMPDLGALLEDQPREAAGVAERGGLAAKPLAAGGIAVGAVVGLLLGLADRAAGLAKR